MAAFYLQVFVVSTVSTVTLVGCGKWICRIAGLRLQSPPFCIVATLAPAFLLMYYAQDAPAARYIACVYVVAAILAALPETVVAALRPAVAERARRQEARRVMLQVAATAAVATAGYALLAGKAPPALIGNNDLYNWFLVAGTLAGNADYVHAAPAAADLWGRLRLDAYGTNWLLAFFAAQYASPIRGTSIFLVSIATWISLAIQWLLVRFFRIGPWTAFAASLLVLGSPLFLYLAFTGLLAQLVATFGSLVLVECLLSLAGSAVGSLASRSRLLAFPVFYLLSVYQSGFAAFLSIGAGLALALSFRDARTAPATGSFARRLALPLLLPLATATAVAGGIVPFVASYLVRRTVAASHLPVGWLLPRFPIHALFYLPYPESTPLWLFDRHNAPLLAYAASLLVSLVAMTALRRNRRLDLTDPRGDIVRRLAPCWAWLWMQILVYAVWLDWRGASYQNWKFATFFSLSLCFVPVATALQVLGLGVQDRTGAPGRAHAGARWMIALAFWGTAGFLTATNASAVAARLVPLGRRIAQLEILKEAPVTGEAVVIDLADYGPSMLAMSIFSDRARLLPLAKTYLPAVADPSAADFDRRTLLLTSAGCAEMIERERPDAGEPRTARTEDFALRPYVPVAGYDFSAAGGACVWGRDIHPGAGFSLAEHWGTWTDGGTAQILLGVPSFMRGSALRVALFVQPFLDSTVARQRAVFSIDGEILARAEIRDRTVVAFVIPGAITRSAQLQLTIALPDAVQPAAADAGHADPRHLALGMRGVMISVLDERQDADQSRP
jgi:hypothetical protein